VSNPSITQPVRRFPKLVLRSFCVSGRRVQIFVAEDLSQAHEIVLVVGQELVSHRVTQQMGMKLEAADCTVFVAEIPHAPVGQIPTLTDEDIGRGNRGPSFQP
jgi:hypothetical protein